MKNLAWIAAATLSVLPWGARAVTFDCAKARSTPEKLICSTPDLSQADDHLKQTFDAARARATDKKAFSDRARQEWLRREKTCTDAACVRQWYADQERLYALAAPARPTSPPPATPNGRDAAPDPQAAPRAHPTPPAPAAPSATNAPEVAATALYSDYKQDETAADRKYKGKTIKVNGTVSGVRTPADGDPYIELTAADNPLPSVHLDFPKTASPRIAQLRKGQKIAVACVVQGLVIGDPVLRCADAP
ncbi:OB-fold protein [Achromobacter aloeverae]